LKLGAKLYHMASGHIKLATLSTYQNSLFHIILRVLNFAHFFHEVYLYKERHRNKA